MTGNAVRDRWVICDEYTAGLFDEQGAARKAEAIARLAAQDAPHACHLEHRIVISDAQPFPPWKKALEGSH